MVDIHMIVTNSPVCPCNEWDAFPDDADLDSTMVHEIHSKLNGTRLNSTLPHTCNSWVTHNWVADKESIA